MGAEDRGVLSFTDKGYAIDLELVDPIFTINGNGDQVQLNAKVRRDEQINRFGRNFRPTLSTLTSRSKTIAKQVQATDRLHGDVSDERFRFIADRV